MRTYEAYARREGFIAAFLQLCFACVVILGVILLLRVGAAVWSSSGYSVTWMVS